MTAPAFEHGAEQVQQNRADAARFMRWIAKPYGCSDQLEVAAIHTKGGGAQAGHLPADRIGEALDALLSKNHADGWNSYLGAAARVGAPEGGRAGDDHVEHSFLAWADIDKEAAAAAALARCKQLGITPCAVVVTGTKPERRLQLWWRLLKPLKPEDLKALLKRLAAALNSDPTVVNPSRVMRLPGTLAWPKPKKEGRVLEVVTLEHLDETLDYDPDELFARAVPPDPEPPDPEPETVFWIDTGATGLDHEETERKIRAGENWNDNVFRMVGSFVAKGLTDEQIHAITDGYTLPGWTVEQTRREVQGMIDRTRAKGFAPEGGAEQAKQAAQDHEWAPVPLELVGFGDASTPYLEDAWLIDGVLPLAGLGVLFGAPGSRKTFTALDMALHAATGRAWREREVERGGVVYLSLEGGRPFANRLAAWRAHHGVDQAPFWRCEARLDLRSSDLDALRVIEAAKGCGAPVRLVVVDTLNRAMPGGNENDVADMSAFVRRCDLIARELGCLVLVVHHSGKDATRGSRGHSCLVAAADVELCLADGVLTITKQRDGEDGLRFGVDLVEVEVGTSTKGRSVTSCVAVEGEAAEAAPKLTSKQQDAHALLCGMALEVGKPNPGGPGWPDAGRVRVVELAEFKAALAGKQTQPELKRRNEGAQRIIDQLIERGAVAINEGYLWPL